MIISHKHRFVFVHNPKVGGTSIRAALEHLHDDPKKFWHQEWDRAESRVVDLAHLTVPQWQRLNVAIDNERYSFFGFVRDPYSRFCSALTEFNRRHGEKIKITPENIELILTPASIRYDWRFIHFCPQWTFFYDLGGSRRCVDRIGRIETLDEDWKSIRNELGLFDAPEVLPHERKGSYAGYNPMSMTTRVREHINRLYMRDFQIFGYDMIGSIHGGAYDDRIEAIHNPVIAAHYNGTEEDHMIFTPGELISFKKVRAQ